MKALPLYLFLLSFFHFFPAFCQYDSLKGGGIYASDFIIDAIPRNITYYMPVGYGKRDAYPLIIFLHSDSGSAKNSIKKWGNAIHAKADAADCVVLYPDAIGGHWRSKINGNSSVKDSVNDVSFIGLMLDFFIQQYNCDVNRIYLLGVGNGGDMCYRFNCERGGKLAALAAINASQNAVSIQNCAAKETIPIANEQHEIIAQTDIDKAMNFLLSQAKKE